MGKMLGRRENVVWNIVDGEAVLLNPETGNYYGLNKTATAIWKLLEKPCTAEELIASVASQFKVSETSIKDHIQTLLDELATRKLITFSKEEHS
jgi:PqqD family protein of HPr-rel-A system